MTKAEAHRFLDAVRAGAAAHESAIEQALRATGDLGPMWLCSRHETQADPEPAAVVVAPWAPPEFQQIGTRVIRFRMQPYSRVST